MRVDAYNQISQLYQAAKPKASSSRKKESASFTDSLELSQAGKDLKTAKDAVREAPDIREERVQEIKRRMANGTYQVSAKEVAEKMVDGIFNQRF